MKKAWLSAAVLAIGLAVSACGGTVDEVAAPQVDSLPATELLPRCNADGSCAANMYCSAGVCRPCLYAVQGDVTASACLPAAGAVEQMSPLCSSTGTCPAGYYCVGGPGGTCRKGIIE